MAPRWCSWAAYYTFQGICILSLSAGFPALGGRCNISFSSIVPLSYLCWRLNRKLPLNASAYPSFVSISSETPWVATFLEDSPMLQRSSPLIECRVSSVASGTKLSIQTD
ncbi:hypothetical protein LshimejAT787_1205320 [Lyophyllum shimeji]|uniref:Uncharacterized protein n=1 Tax=Lyophyllum shimeji TaxID=47721 RepID=A0A9P3PWW2_LYOSH|nr:hypothetical protein LshimejAT787_1205320 [Lyophyllum shimeji]